MGCHCYLGVPNSAPGTAGSASKLSAASAWLVKYIVPLEKGTKPMTWPEPQGQLLNLRGVIQNGRVSARYYAGRTIQEYRRIKHRAIDNPAIWHENKGGQVASHPYCCVLRANASHNYLLVNGKRRLTERELLRLQGFPEWYVPTGTYSQTK